MNFRWNWWRWGWETQLFRKISHWNSFTYSIQWMETWNILSCDIRNERYKRCSKICRHLSHSKLNQKYKKTWDRYSSHRIFQNEHSRFVLCFNLRKRTTQVVTWGSLAKFTTISQVIQMNWKQKHFALSKSTEFKNINNWTEFLVCSHMPE